MVAAAELEDRGQLIDHVVDRLDPDLITLRNAVTSKSGA